MSVSSLEFLLPLLLAAACFFRLPGTRARQLVFAGCTAGFVYSYVSRPVQWIALLAFLLSGYGCARLLIRRSSRALFTLYIILLVAVFAILKKYDFVKPCIPRNWLDLHLEIVGLSYILFRQIHFVVDAMQGQIERPSLWTYVNYQLNPFVLLAGPIQRYQDFARYFEQPQPVLNGRHEVLKAFLRFFVGVIKVVVIAEACRKGYDHLLAQLDGAGPLSPGGLRAAAKLAMMLYLFLFYLYLNFSGYCDIVIAGASLVGLRLPENFNFPFLARNILDYWSRWHITLGYWIRDYLFTPFYKAGAEKFPGHSQSVAVVGYFVAFSAAGIWHGSTWNFLVYGLMHGAGAAAAKLWESIIVQRAGRPGLRQYLKSQPIRWAAVVATFHYACFSLFFFALDLGRGEQILGNILRSFTRGY